MSDLALILVVVARLHWVVVSLRVARLVARASFTQARRCEGRLKLGVHSLGSSSFGKLTDSFALCEIP